MNDLGCLLVIQDQEEVFFCTAGNGVMLVYCCCGLVVTANNQLTVRSPYVCVRNFSSA